MDSMNMERASRYYPDATIDPLTWSRLMIKIYWELYKRCNDRLQVSGVNIRKLVRNNYCGHAMYRLSEVGAVTLLERGWQGFRIYQLAEVEIPLSPRQVCELFGVTKPTLLNWEMQGFVSPKKSTATGHRCFFAADIEGLTKHKLLAVEREQGQKRRGPKRKARDEGLEPSGPTEGDIQVG